MKLISGTFQKDCGIIVEHNGKYYHKIVFEDDNGNCFVELDNKRIYESEEKIMYTELDEVRVKTHGSRIGVVEKVYYEMVNGKETDNVYCYEMKIDGISGCIVYPDEIDE